MNMEKEDEYKRPILLLTVDGSHINLIDRNFNIFSEKYKFIKYKVHSQYPQYENTLYNLLETISENDKKSNNVTIVMANINSMLFSDDFSNELKEFKNILGTEKDVDFPKIKEPKEFGTTENYICWFRFFKYIQDYLDNDICFLFTTYLQKEKFVQLMEIANDVGLRNFRFIEDPFLTRELEQQLDNLILRFYTNKILYNKRLNRRRKLFKEKRKIGFSQVVISASG